MGRGMPQPQPVFDTTGGDCIELCSPLKGTAAGPIPESARVSCGRQPLRKLAMFTSPFRQPGNWYRANLHAHTTASDGQTPLDQRIEQYRPDYSILAITDHGMVVDVAGRSTGDFLLINGIEESVRGFRDGRRFHMLCLGVPADFEFDKESDPNDLIARVNALGGVAFLAHPYCSACNVTDFVALRDCAGIEVFNASQWGGGHAFASVHWDVALEAGVRMPAIAVDDTHSGPAGDYDLCAGYTMLKMPELSLEAALEALRTGCFYASMGPEIVDFRIEDGVAGARFSEAKEVRFLGLPPRGHIVWARDGDPLTEAQVEVGEHWRYVRLEVLDADGRFAWANPIAI